MTEETSSETLLFRLDPRPNLSNNFFLFSLPLQPFIYPTMLSRSAIRAATQSSRLPGAARAASLAATGKAQAVAPCTSSSSTLPIHGRRYISMYGYTQAKALVYSKYGEPKDVLRSVATQLPFHALCNIYQAQCQSTNLNTEPVCTNTPSPHPTAPR